ncbi:hypothetical protein C8R46DRAFT_1059969 [Mycena filopes]|nr:hypothetical protein C8R46DRAFT_1059969 [Mycena filopes]
MVGLISRALCTAQGLSSTMSTSATPTDETLSALPPSDFAAMAPSLLPKITHSPTLADLFVSRLTTSPATLDNPLVSAIKSTLDTAAETAEAATLRRFLLIHILVALPKDQIELYYATLTHLAASADENLSQPSTDLIAFLDGARWAPRSKSDFLAFRSLDAVQSAEEMRPHVDELLGWLQDSNWPPFSGCWDQLARFPDVALTPICELLRIGDDGPWSYCLLVFLKQSMPGQLRERARVDVERIAQRPTQDELDNDCVEAAQECLQAMDDWKDRARIVPERK